MNDPNHDTRTEPQTKDFSIREIQPPHNPSYMHRLPNIYGNSG